MKSWMEVGRMSGSFILKSAQQKEALHRICCSSPCSRLLPDCASNPLAGPAGRQSIYHELRLKLYYLLIINS
ncbi:unnamed protein product [Spirodela intermedia]|uniref:Uncharacterized protein n=1 Tax=Spirodela intermedia TaxID=51605 RepID=A0A7I8JZJ8_SPIIN|nr:unnamed protein product [Spirodela intermedia]